MDPLLISTIALHLLAVADIWFSQLGRGTKVLWSINVLFLVGVGLVAWLITRGSAYRPPPDIPPAEEAAQPPA